MENYIKKINHQVLKSNDDKGAKKVKKIYLISGGITLGLGLAGFFGSFVTFLILFLKFKTDDAMTAWLVAVPFMAMIIAGSVVTRIGDMLLKPEVEEEYLSDKLKKNRSKEEKMRFDIGKQKIKAEYEVDDEKLEKIEKKEQSKEEKLKKVIVKQKLLNQTLQEHKSMQQQIEKDTKETGVDKQDSNNEN